MNPTFNIRDDSGGKVGADNTPLNIPALIGDAKKSNKGSKTGGTPFTAHTVNHEKPQITYGLYSSGASLEVKREALEKVGYPFSKK